MGSVLMGIAGAILQWREGGREKGYGEALMLEGGRERGVWGGTHIGGREGGRGGREGGNHVGGREGGGCGEAIMYHGLCPIGHSWCDLTVKGGREGEGGCGEAIMA